MIYLRLHQARIEEVEAEASRSNWDNFAILAKFCYIAKISPVAK